MWAQCWIGVVGVVLVAVAAGDAAAGQVQSFGDWVSVETEDDFTGERSRGAISVRGFGSPAGPFDDIIVAVHCEVGAYTVFVSLGQGGVFQNGTVGVRWDEGTAERHEFYNAERALVAWQSPDKHGAGVGYEPLPVGRFVDKLRRHNELRIRVAKSPNRLLSARLSLRGANWAIETLPCSGSR